MLLSNQSTGLRTIWLQKQGWKKKIRHPLKLVYIDSFIVSLHRQPQLGNKVLPHEDWNNEKDFYFHLICLLLLSICSIPLLTHRHELGKNDQPSPSSTSFDWLMLGVLIPNSQGRQNYLAQRLLYWYSLDWVSNLDWIIWAQGQDQRTTLKTSYIQLF